MKENFENDYSSHFHFHFLTEGGMKERKRPTIGAAFIFILTPVADQACPVWLLA